MRKWTRKIFLVGLVLVGIVSPARSHIELKQQKHGAVRAVGRTAVSSDAGSDSFEDWWNRSKRAIQELTACGLGSASLTYGMIVGVGFPPGGAILTGLGAGLVVAFCL